MLAHLLELLAQGQAIDRLERDCPAWAGAFRAQTARPRAMARSVKKKPTRTGTGAQPPGTLWEAKT